MGTKVISLFLVLFIVTLLVLPTINSAAVIVNTGEEGLQIFHSEFKAVKKDVGFTLYLHVANKSSGFPLNNTQVSCYLHLYGGKGNHTLESGILDRHNIFDHEIAIDPGNFSSTGIKGFYIWCNDSVLGGEAKGTFVVTATGTEFTIQQAIIYIILFAVVIFIFLITFFGIGMLPKSNTKDEEGKIMQISYAKYLRSALWFVEWILFITILFLSSNIATAYLDASLFANLLFNLFRICLSITPIIVIIWFFYLMVQFLQDKKLNDMMKRGLFPQHNL